MRSILAMLVFAATGSVDANTQTAFANIVQEADNERALLKSATQRFRSIAAKMPALFRQ